MSEWRDVKLERLGALSSGKSVKPGGVGAFTIFGSNGPIGGSDMFTHRKGVIIGRVGAYCGSVEVSNRPFWASDNTIVFEPELDSDVLFAYFLLKHADLNRHAGGSAQPLLTQTALKALSFRVPDESGRSRIASVLGSIDDLIENNRRRIVVLEEMAQAIYREWFVHFRYPGHEDAIFVDSPVGPLPERWELHPASDALEINPRTKSLKDVAEPFITMGDLDERGMVCFPNDLKIGASGSKFMNGDTLFARITPCLENGKTGFVMGLDEGQVGRGSTEFVVLRGAMVGPSFTYFLARHDEFRSHAIASMSGASGRQRVRNECFDSYKIPVPTRDVGLAFEDAATPMMQNAFALATSSRSLTALRDLLLPKLVTGEIDVSAVDLDALVGAES